MPAVVSHPVSGHTLNWFYGGAGKHKVMSK